FTWTCTPTGSGASCGTPTGTGNINARVEERGVAKATITVRGTLPSDTTGALANTVTDTPPPRVGDLVSGHVDGTTTKTTGGAQADLGITKTSTPDPYVPGAAFTYTIVVSNAGPSNVSNAQVQDVLPAPLAAFTWTCTPSGTGASCGTPTGTGNINA